MLLLTGCGDAPAPATVQFDSGIKGRTMVDGGCAVQSQDRPCPDKPVSAKLLVTQPGSDKVIATVASDPDGRYEVRLAPGDYILTGTASTGAPLPFAKPVEVTVRAHRFTTRVIRFDSGIR